MTDEDHVRAASDKFYAALNTMLAGDASALDGIWVRGPIATTMHPIGGREIGWEHVRAAFEKVAQLSTGGQVTLADQLIYVEGDVARELGVERAEFSIAGRPLSVNSRVTNIYLRSGEDWKIVHHHGDKSPGIQEALDRD